MRYGYYNTGGFHDVLPRRMATYGDQDREIVEDLLQSGKPYIPSQNVYQTDFHAYKMFIEYWRAPKYLQRCDWNCSHYRNDGCAQLFNKQTEVCMISNDKVHISERKGSSRSAWLRLNTELKEETSIPGSFVSVSIFHYFRTGSK